MNCETCEKELTFKTVCQNCGDNTCIDCLKEHDLCWMCE